MASELTTSVQASEVSRGERFEFGKNWSRFLSTLDDAKIDSAMNSLRTMLEIDDLTGKRFLDIGSGSGLFSLAARRLGASVFSFDYDPNSMACTAELRRRYFPHDDQWNVAEGSALDADYVRSLGQFDVVYSWGVLHHTGDMWTALENAQIPVAPGGKLFIAIYNDTGSQARRWLWIKKTYNRLPSFARIPFALIVSAPSQAKSLLGTMLGYGRQSKERGMNRWHDMIDWVGGYPYEVAAPEEIFEFYKQRGFALAKLRCGGVGLGCNEYVLIRKD
ncbi:MAG TPA: class I SAM-dependent methyltransferase [Pyrinomonadaceae bacterium]|jgi:2-polyprenyl-6-hydroxyphenyl methylase/3-demethylubiquinone-9 3-methyltransferase|nr:class I SAM-dependent methyltransferase [Pyrinomonadaceae bacterium]